MSGDTCPVCQELTQLRVRWHRVTLRVLVVVGVGVAPLELPPPDEMVKERVTLVAAAYPL